MKHAAAELAPTAAVLVLLAYWCWPYATGPSSVSPSEAGGKVPVIASTLLSPPLPSAPQRDPFRVLASSEPTSDPADGDPRSVTPTTASQENSEGETGEVSDSESQRTLPSFTLNATLIRNDYRAAVINDRVYTVGDALSAAGSGATEFVVAEIHPNKVIVASGNQSLELLYSGPDPPHDVARSVIQSQSDVPSRAQPATRHTPRSFPLDDDDRIQTPRGTP